MKFLCALQIIFLLPNNLNSGHLKKILKKPLHPKTHIYKHTWIKQQTFFVQLMVKNKISPILLNDFYFLLKICCKLPIMLIIVCSKCSIKLVFHNLFRYTYWRPNDWRPNDQTPNDTTPNMTQRLKTQRLMTEHLMTQHLIWPNA